MRYSFFRSIFVVTSLCLYLKLYVFSCCSVYQRLCLVQQLWVQQKLSPTSCASDANVVCKGVDIFGTNPIFLQSCFILVISSYESINDTQHERTCFPSPYKGGRNCTYCIFIIVYITKVAQFSRLSLYVCFQLCSCLFYNLPLRC